MLITNMRRGIRRAVTSGSKSGRGGGGTFPLNGLSGLTWAGSMSRRLLSTFNSSFYAATSGAVTTIYDQSGAGNGDLSDATVAAREPAESTGGPNGRALADFDGSSDFLIFGAGRAASNFVTTSAGFIIMSVIVDAYVTNSANSYQNDVLIQDASGIVGMTARNTGGGTLYAQNWDGTDDHADSTTLGTATAGVLTWRHDTGTLYLTVNAVETSVASGNSTSLVGNLQVGKGFGAFGNFKLFELAIFNAVPTSGQRTALIADFRNWVGA